MPGNPNANQRFDRALALCLAVTGFALAAAGSGCVNSRLSSLANQLANSGKPGTSGVNGGSGTTSSGIDKFVIGNVIVATAPTGGGGGAAAGPPITIYIDPSHSTPASGTTAPFVSQHCSTGTNGKPCTCQFTWSETNASAGNNQPFTRTVQQPVTNVQQQVVACTAPDVYSTEIADGTTIKVTIIPVSGNADSSLFTFNTFNFVKTTTTTAGSFQDAQGHAFENIVHYSCFEQFQIGTAIQSKIGTKTNPQTGETTTYPIANQFCVQNPGQQPSPDCPNLPASSVNSAQAYYYNFFTRVSLVGAVNQWNDRYTCPSVKEAIYNAGGVGTQSQLYPMDTNFALSVNSNSTFNIGVNGFVELSDGGGDPVAVGATLCDGTAPANSGNGATDGFVQACLGFATKPSSDGTCPYIHDSSGAVRFTYRLRRFIALYPPLFGISGKQPTKPQRSDTIYVLDRPVTPPTGADPLKPYTMRGPKPCPFSMFDNAGVLKIADANYPKGYLPAYAATNNSLWSGTNVDGVQLPNSDSRYSCSAALPLVRSDPLNPDLTTITIGTVNKANPVLQSVYIRPIHSWAPHYEEDTSFQACAPQAAPAHDPPMHFAKDPTSGNVSWCAEVYPSQNDHVTALDSLYNPGAPPSGTNAYIGHVKPFTSHVAKNSLSNDCTATIPSSIPSPVSGSLLYPAPSSTSTTACATPNLAPAGIAWHPSDMQVDTKQIYPLPLATPPVASVKKVCANQTCDRTAVITGGLGWPKFPLLASALQTEIAISSDSTYGCVMTYDGGGPKTGKASPYGGCCGSNVILNTGFTPPSGQTAYPPGLVNTNAHLEPDAPCLIPKY